MTHAMIIVALVAAGAPTTPRPTGPTSAQFVLPALMFAALAFLLLTTRSQKKREQRERESMHARLAKNDRILTAGGIIGTVIAVKEHEVIVKVDESTNTKMTFLKTAIQRILTEDREDPAHKA